MQLFLEFLNGQMNQPELYGSFKASWFHYLALLLVCFGSVMAITRMKDISEKKLNRILMIFSITLVLFEVYKQVIFTYQAAGDYQWYAFPFQFCSTPMYVGLAASLIKHKQIKHALLSFLATFGLFAGLAVVFYPSTVFISTIGINIQTMVHHGGMAIIGIGLLAHHIKLKWSSLIQAALVFALLLGLAIGMNAIFNTWIQDGTFNMFFINPRFENGVPVLSLFQPLVPHAIFVLIYLFGFTLCASIVFGGRLIISKMVLSKRETVYQKA